MFNFSELPPIDRELRLQVEATYYTAKIMGVMPADVSDEMRELVGRMVAA